MTSRAAVLAIAAPLLLTVPALAQPAPPIVKGKVAKSIAAERALHGAPVPLVPPVRAIKHGKHAKHAKRHHHGHAYGYGYTRDYGQRGYYGHGHRGYQVNQFGQTKREVRSLRREAFQTCAAKVARKGYRAGAYDVDVHRSDSRVRQIAPYGFVVRMKDVHADTPRGYVSADVTCKVRRGRVVDLDGMPHYAPRGYGYRY
ncbi:MAG: hypothetical protein QNI84_05645 [Henriciella sp.]|nr:hypothetical protein [Henriciella sp.]